MIILQPLSDFGILPIDPETGEIFSIQEGGPSIFQQDEAVIYTPNVNIGDAMLVIFHSDQISISLADVLKILWKRPEFTTNLQFQFSLYLFSEKGWETSVLNPPELITTLNKFSMRYERGSKPGRQADNPDDDE